MTVSGGTFDNKLSQHCRLLLTKPDGTRVHPEDGIPGAPYIKDAAHLKVVKKMCRIHLSEMKAIFSAPTAVPLAMAGMAAS